MRLTLLHNPDAGREHTSKEYLLAVLGSAGYEVVYQSAEGEGIAQALRDPGDLVAVAGGDGTVAQAARHLLERRVPLGILPFGTANNIAKMLGVAGPLQQIIAGWPSARRTPFDVGLAQGPWGKAFFLEAAGLGLFPYMMRKGTENGSESTRNAREQLRWDLKRLQETLKNAPARPVELYLDGRDRSGVYVLLEAMNLSHLGPNLSLAPQADPGDGVLDLALLPASDRAVLATYLDDRLAGRPGVLDLPVYRGRHVQLRWEDWEDAPFHVDDKTYGTGSAPREPVDLRVLPRALTFLT